MKITANRNVTFTPEFSENLALPEEERIVVTYEKAKPFQRDEWGKIVAYYEGDKLKTENTRSYRKIIKDSNVRIEHLIAEVDGEEREIKTGEELLELRSSFAYDLIGIIANKIYRGTSAEEIKN